jgi:CRISPR-associated protein Cmr6
MTSALLLPNVRKHVGENAHPGLQLDKYATSGEQAVQKTALEEVVGVANAEGGAARQAFKEARSRREAFLAAIGARTIAATARTPLTLHLARSSALENAGISFHRIGGFPCLPGTGVKGMARAYAELVVREASGIERIFGPRLASGEDRAAAGTVVFHDAWPVDWPKLLVDITNNHHPVYYGDEGGKAPGDWEDPIPVYFLAVAPGTKLEFAVSARDPSVADRDLELAAEWLRGALVHLGAGAKTAGGYGWMNVERAPSDSRGTVVHYDLELVTPAFLAGAGQKKEDCTLRPSTLRGLLRWWWRTMHAGYLDSKTLYALESAIFGSTKVGQSAFDLVVTPLDNRHPIVPQRRSPGTAYAAYGMAERSRACHEAGTRWQVELRFHGDRTINTKKHPHHPLAEKPIRSDVIKREVESALFLLCRFGAAGSKARKGFGSFATPTQLAALDLGAISKSAAETRRSLGLASSFDQGRLNNACSIDFLARVGERRDFIQIETRLTDAWAAMDRVGQALQEVAAGWAPKEEKIALGLPRRGTDKRDIARHASPVHISLDRGRERKIVVRVIAFVAGRLPTARESRVFLERYLPKLEESLRRLVSGPPPATSGGPPAHRGSRPRPGGRLPERRAAPAPPPGGLAVGQRVEVELIGEKSRQGGWKAKLVSPPHQTGSFENSKDIPADVSVGQRVTAVIAAIPTRGHLNLRWPKAT